jgi:hypothetical protein
LDITRGRACRKKLGTSDIAGLDDSADSLLHVAGSSRKRDVNTTSGLSASLDTSSEGVNPDHLQVTTSMVNAALDEEASTGSLVNEDGVIRVGAGGGGGSSGGSSA